MRTKKKVVFVLALAVLLLISAGLAQAADDATKLSGEEILAFVKGKSMMTDNARWGAVYLTFAENGTLTGSNRNQEDTGTWSVENGKLCMNWRKWEYEGCGEVKKKGKEIQHYWPNGRLHFTYP